MGWINVPDPPSEHLSVLYTGPREAGKKATLEALEVLAYGVRSDRRRRYDQEIRATLLWLEPVVPLFAGLSRAPRGRVTLAAYCEMDPPSELRTRLVRSADAMVFVADSRLERLEANLETLDYLGIVFNDDGVDLAALPVALQYNRRDAEPAAGLDALDRELRSMWPFEWPRFESVAPRREGVVEPLREAVRGALQRREVAR